MKTVSPEEAIQGKYPEWVMLVISTDADGKPNVMPAGWCMICNRSPLMLAVAVATGRYTYTCLEETGEFILAFAGEGQEKLIEQTGACSGRDVNKFDKLGLVVEEASEVAAPLIAGCAAAFECQVVSELELEDHAIFVGEVVAAHVADPQVAKLDNFNGVYAVAQPKQ